MQTDTSRIVPRHVPGLDGLRAIGIWAVMLLHVGIPTLRGGHVGVDVFFVLSGFLITRNVLFAVRLDGFKSLKNFFLRRIARIYPALLIFEVVMFFVTFFPAAPSDSENYLVTAALSLAGLNHVQRFFLPTYPWLLHLWSLSVEETFYFFWPFVATIVAMAATRRSAWFLLAAMMLGSMALFLAAVQIFNWDVGVLIGTFASYRYHSLFFGCVVALIEPIWRGKKSARSRAISRFMMAMAFLVMLTVITKTHDLVPPAIDGVWAYEQWVVSTLTFVVAISVVVILFCLIQDEQSCFVRVLEKPYLVFSGEISYGLFLWHYPIATVFFTYGFPWWVTLPVTFVASYLLAWLSSRFVEMPARRWVRRRF